MTDHSILLDTHVWIWLVNGDKTLLPKTRKLINETAKKGKIFISAISVWELSMLDVKGRITLGTPCLEWVHRSLALPGMHYAALSPEIAVESSHLPGTFHGDPADRMIVATARVEGYTLLTRDTQILSYSKKKYISAMKV